MATVHVFLEGPDDERFFRSVLSPSLTETYDTIRTYLYAQRSKKDVETYIRTLHDSQQDYIVIADLDSSGICYSGRKNTLCTKIPHVRHDNIAIVKTEIESWYLAGLGQRECELLQIPYHTSTEHISKSEFEQMRVRSGSMQRAQFLIKILDMFDVGRAKKQNTSFEYVWDKFVYKTS